jgi:hypothetical protein
MEVHMTTHKLVDLDETTRKWMMEEYRRDLDQGTLFVSPLLTDRGRREYADLLKEAIEHHDEVWLASALGSGDRMNLTQRSVHQGAGASPGTATHTGRPPSKNSALGGEESQEMPNSTPEVLAEGEFNRYYARGLCRRAIDEGMDVLEIYRYGRAAGVHFTDQSLDVPSEPGIDRTGGTTVDPRELLASLRKSPEEELDTGLPGEPDSGLSVRLPETRR